MAAKKKKTVKPLKKQTAKPAAKTAKRATGKSAKPSAKAKPAKVAKTVAKSAKRPTQSLGRSVSKPQAKNPAIEFVASDPGRIQPVRDHVLVSEVEMLEKTPGGLYIPQTVMGRELKGKVLAVGQGALDKKGRRRPLDVRVGDLVVYSQYVGLQIKIGGSQYLLLKESEILGIAQS